MAEEEGQPSSQFSIPPYHAPQYDAPTPAGRFTRLLKDQLVSGGVREVEKEKGGARVWDGRLRGTQAKAYLVRSNPKEVLPTDTPPPKEPSTRKEALESDHEKEWITAMDEEMKARGEGHWTNMERIGVVEGRYDDGGV